MEPLMALCDLVAQKPVELTGKLTWMCNLCPQPDEMRSGSPRVTRSQLNAVLAISRFLSKGPDPSDPRPSSLALEFFRSISASFALSFWPQSSSDFSPDFSDYLGYLTLAAQLSPDFYVEIAGFVGKVVTAAIDYYYAATGEEIFFVPRAFLVSLLKHFPSIVPSDGERLVEYLLERDGVTWTSGMEVVLLGSREQVAYFEEERLEKQGIKFKLITHVMVHVMNNDQQLEQVRLVSKKHLGSLSAFLKIKKRVWNEQGQLLKARGTAKLAAYQAAAIMNIRSLPSPGANGKNSKRLVLEADALSMAAKSCSLSMWLKLRICERYIALWGCTNCHHHRRSAIAVVQVCCTDCL